MEKIVVIVGPTGVGKTSLSIAIAKYFQGEIISGDSMQVYHEMSVGTAKIKEAEKQGIPHYLVDEFHVDEEYNVKVFQEKARASIQAISDKGNLAIICGGTGLYIKSVVYDYQFLEQQQDEEFLSFLQARSNDELYALLTIIDEKSCEKIHPHNRQRMIRALSMAHDGEKKSDIVDAQAHAPIMDAYIIGLTMDRDKLYERINQRVDQMMKEGLLDEIKGILATHKNAWELQSFQGIGYKEWKPYFDGECDIDCCVEAIKKNSRNFAKRQYTWFKNQMNVHWYDIEDEQCQEEIIQDLSEWRKRG